MDKETLSNYGWIVICILILAVMLALATPFGNFIAGAIKSTTAGFFNVNQGALSIAGIDIDNQEFPEPPAANDGKIEYDVGDPDLNPDDGSIPQEGDIYEYGDYIYTYSECRRGILAGVIGWDVNLNLEVTDRTKSQYGPILEKINGQPIVNLYGTFEDCTNLQQSPTIPKTVAGMISTFYNCSSLVEAPVIPNSIISIDRAFHNCTALCTAPNIINCNNITSLCETFWNCKNLKTYTGSTDPDGDFSNWKVPNGVTSMEYTFYNCTSLTVAPDLQHVTSLKKMYGTFQGCKSLVTIPIIPENVSDMSCTFYWCSNLVSAPIIPANVDTLVSTFAQCQSLSGNITINTIKIYRDYQFGANSCNNCFGGVDMSNIVLTGSASKDVLNLIGGTGDNWTPIE